MTTKKVVSTRMTQNELAKARDGLIAKGLDSEQIDNISQILRLTFYYGLLAISDDPKSPASDESILFIKQRLGQSKSGGPVTLDDLINSNEA